MKKSELKALIAECVEEVMSEKKDKWIQKAVHPSREGKFEDKTIGELKDMLINAKKQSDSHKEKDEKVPHDLRKRISQLVFAIRAKQSGGLKKGSTVK